MAPSPNPPIRRMEELQALLKQIVEPDGKAYFQPPENVQMVYPAIVYFRDDQLAEFASNRSYRRTDRYQLTVIDRNPRSEICRKLEDATNCEFVRSFTTTGLNHNVYNLYF